METSRVLYINEISRVAGVETCLLNFFDALSGSDVVPILLCPEGPFAEAARTIEVKVITYNFYFHDISTHKFRHYFLFGIFRLFDTFAIYRVIKANKVNIVHSVSAVGHTISSLLRKSGLIKAVWHIHGEHNLQLYRFFKPDFIVFVAKIRQKILHNLSLENKRRFSVIYNGIDSNLYASSKLETITPLYIGCIGRLLPEKGIEDLLLAAPIIIEKHPETQFSIFGEEIYDNVNKGKYTKTLKEKITEARKKIEQDQEELRKLERSG